MKSSLLLFLLLSFGITVIAQTKTKTVTKTSAKTPVKQVVKKCPPLVVDLTTATINRLTPASSMATIKLKLPCFTGTTAEGGGLNCGGGVFYLNNGIYFYTSLNAIEVRGKYTGIFKKDGEEVKLLGISADDLGELMGEPDEDSETDEDNFVNIYQAGNGSVRVVVRDGEVVEVSLHSQAPGKIKVCEGVSVEMKVTRID